MIKDKNDTVRRIHSDSVFFWRFSFFKLPLPNGKTKFKNVITFVYDIGVKRKDDQNG